MNTLWLTKSINYLARFAQLQLFITLFSMPILICWGLPISILSPLGNLIFGPALTAFLFLSSLIFFTELLYIPNDWFITALEYVTQWWLAIMHADSHRWLIGFAKPSMFILLLFTLAAVLVMLNKKTNSIGRSIACFSMLMMSLCLYAYCIASPRSLSTSIPCNQGDVHIMVAQGKTIVIDPGYMGARLSAPSWAQYTLIPQLLQKTGKNAIDHLIVLQPNGMLFQALERLCTKIQVHTIYMPYWEGTMKRSALHHYGGFKHVANEHKTQIERLGKKPIRITIDAANYLLLKPTGKVIKKQDISYPAYAIDGRIDNQSITLYSARCLKKKPTNARTIQTA